MLPWVQNNERHQAPGWAFSIMTSYVNLWRHMTAFDVIWRHDDVIMENAQHGAGWRSLFCTQGSIHYQNPSGKWLHYGLSGSASYCLGFPWTIRYSTLQAIDHKSVTLGRMKMIFRLGYVRIRWRTHWWCCARTWEIGKCLIGGVSNILFQFFEILRVFQCRT